MSRPLALQCCPNCRRNVAAEALVCRSCYTVLPRKKKKEEELVSIKASRRLLAGPLKIMVVMIIAAGLWLGRVDLGLVPPNGAEKGGLGGVGFLFLSGSSNSAMTSSGGTASHGSVLKRNGNCVLTQGVRNLGATAATRAGFHIQFKDAEGSMVGDPAIVEKRTAISPGHQEKLELVAPCPKLAVGAQVAVLESATATELQPKLELLSTPLRSNRFLASKNRSTIVLEVADQSVCTPPEGCDLKVSFGEGREASYRFQRDQHNPELLLNDNSIFIGHLLAGNPATLHLDEKLNGTTISLTYNNVHEQEPPGFLEKLWDLLPWRSGDEG